MPRIKVPSLAANKWWGPSGQPTTFDQHGCAEVAAAEDVDRILAYHRDAEIVPAAQGAEELPETEAVEPTATEEQTDDSSVEKTIKARLDLSSLTVPELRKLAEQVGVELPGFVKRSQIIAALEPVVNPVAVPAEG